VPAGLRNATRLSEGCGFDTRRARPDRRPSSIGSVTRPPSGTEKTPSSGVPSPAKRRISRPSRATYNASGFEAPRQAWIFRSLPRGRATQRSSEGPSVRGSKVRMLPSWVIGTSSTDVSVPLQPAEPGRERPGSHRPYVGCCTRRERRLPRCFRGCRRGRCPRRRSARRKARIGQVDIGTTALEVTR